MKIASDYSEGEEAEWRVGRALSWVFWAEKELNQAITNMQDLHSASEKIEEMGPLVLENVICGILEDGSDDQPAEHSRLIRRYNEVKDRRGFSKKKIVSRRPKGYLCRNFSNEDKAFEVLGYRLKDLARIVDEVMSYIEEDKDIFKDGNAPEDATRALAKLLWEADGSWLEPEYMRALKRRLAVYH